MFDFDAFASRVSGIIATMGNIMFTPRYIAYCMGIKPESRVLQKLVKNVLDNMSRVEKITRIEENTYQRKISWNSRHRLHI